MLITTLVRTMAAAVTLGLAATACGASDTQEPAGGSLTADCPDGVDTPIKGDIVIGVSTPLSGPAAAYGGSSVGFRAAIKKVNAAGGIDGHKIKVVVRDDQFDPRKTVQNTEQLISKDKVDILAAIPGTANALAVKDLVDDACVPNLFALSGDPRLFAEKNTWTLASLPPYDLETRIYAKDIAKRFPDGAKVAIIAAGNESGKVFTTHFKKALKSTNARVVSEQTVDAAVVTPPTSAVAVAKDKDADVVVNFLGAVQSPGLLSAIAKAGWKPLVYQNANSSVIPVGLAPAKAAADGVLTANWKRDLAVASAAKDPAAKELIDAVRAIDSHALPLAFPMPGYIFGQGVTEVIRQAAEKGDLTRASIMRTTRNLKPFHIDLMLDGIQYSSGPDHTGLIDSLVLQQFDADKQEWVAKGEPTSGD